MILGPILYGPMNNFHTMIHLYDHTLLPTPLSLRSHYNTMTRSQFVVAQYACCGVNDYQDFNASVTWPNTRDLKINNETLHSVALVTPIVCCATTGAFPSVDLIDPVNCATNPDDVISNWNRVGHHCVVHHILNLNVAYWSVIRCALLPGNLIEFGLIDKHAIIALRLSESEVEVKLWLKYKITWA